ncbi:DNA-directed RNA polymerase I subunit rpa49 [Geranomyces variabilis]|nr:DNA-directed RNA polymerase I subunit rpa49 [Geranomyces variabilis]
MPPSSKKTAAGTGNGVIIQAAEMDPSPDAPIFVSFPDLPSKSNSVGFQTFSKRPAGAASAVAQKRRRIVVGQTPKLEYVGNNDAKSFCRYVVGVFDKETKQLTLQETELFHLTTTVKTLKQHESRHIGEKNMTARNALGEAFGTKKRRQAIKAMEKNQVDVSGLTDVSDIIKGAIDEKTAAIPTRSEIAEDTKQDRAIPPYNAAAQTPSEVYAPEDLATDAELKALQFKQLWKIRGSDDVKAQLAPMSLTSWVWDKMHACLRSKDDVNRFRRLLYLGFLMKFYTLKDRDLNSGRVAERVGGAPAIVADTFMTKFTEFQEDNGRTKYRVSPKLKDKMLAYILALKLTLNEFKLDVNHISSDMGIPITRLVKVARELGCRVDNKRDEEGTARKKVVLTVPLTFPTRTR